MAGSNVIQINNSKGNLLIRNDITPINCMDYGFWPKTTPRANGNQPAPSGWGMKKSDNIGMNSNYCFTADVSLEGYGECFIAFRPDSFSQVVDSRIVYDSGKKARIWSGEGEYDIQYFIFAAQPQRTEDCGLQLYHPDTGAVTFDSCWDMMLPVKVVRVPTDGSYVAHGLGYKPAIMPLNTAAATWVEQHSKHDNYCFFNYGVSVDETNLRCACPHQNNGPIIPQPFYQTYIDVLLINVNHI